MGAIMVLLCTPVLPSLKSGTFEKEPVNALVKIIVDFAVSTIAYFFHRLCVSLRCFFSNARVTV